MADDKISWGLIMVAILVFWPVGLYLLLRKTRSSRKATLAENNFMLLKKASYVVVAVTLYSIIRTTMTMFSVATITDVPMMRMVLGGLEELFTRSLFLIGGLILWRYSNKMLKKAKGLKQYITVIVNQEIYYISQIARTMNITEKKVIEDLKYMIANHYFENAYIDQVERKIVLQPLKKDTQAQQRVKKHSILCSGCGAMNTVVEESQACEYCGTIVS